MKKWEEQIIVVPRRELFSNGKLIFQGTETDPDKVQQILLNIEAFHNVMRRGGGYADPESVGGNAEINFNLKQPIPYAVIKRGHEVFVYERLEGGGETRLHGKLSIGVGGHMNKNGGFNESLIDNLNRELNEELDIQTNSMHLETVGLINDDVNEVGRVHIGLLVVVTVPEGTVVEVREKDQLKGQWVPIAVLVEDSGVYERLESWSQIAIDELYNKLPDSQTLRY
jgi:predicted NUDIX family phosphoesterase